MLTIGCQQTWELIQQLPGPSGRNFPAYQQPSFRFNGSIFILNQPYFVTG